ncbi:MULTISPECIES: hypothetical protein [unclassified Moraxella]|uniref:hypothetical protein n=1 Tax=unclassified Moraxella TaxID=2685852 RepID=UPI003AF815BB
MRHSLAQFRQQLLAKIEEIGLSEYYARPFVCTGSPLACQIMTVGFNPSRNVGLDIFDHEIWQDDIGFDRERFVEYYDLAGYQQGESKWSRNHIVQQNLIDELVEYPVLETYLYSTISHKKSQLTHEFRRTEVFDWLVQTIAPKVIITQNSEVTKYFEKATNECLTRNAFNTVHYQGHPCVIYPISHLSKKWTFSEIQALREHIIELLDLLNGLEPTEQAKDRKSVNSTLEVVEQTMRQEMSLALAS